MMILWCGSTNSLTLNPKACVCLKFGVLPRQAMRLMQREVDLFPGMIHQFGFFWDVTMYIQWWTYVLKIGGTTLSKVSWIAQWRRQDFHQGVHPLLYNIKNICDLVYCVVL